MKTLAMCALALIAAAPASGSAASDAAFLRDRGPGVPTSMFGTYIGAGELLVYPFVEFYVNHDEEYSPQELGYVLDEDFRGEFEATEGLVFVGYGLTSNLALELEAAMISAELETSPDDPTAVPGEISESGLGDVQTQVDWLWLRETEGRPAMFSYSEVVFPFQKDKLIIGTSDWEFKVGTGAVKGFGFGTMTARAAVEYNRDEDKVELGEVAVEYLRRFSRLVRAYAGVEGTQDEVELITELQLHVSDRMFIKLNSGFGLTSKATDWAPETGLMFRF